MIFVAHITHQNTHECAHIHKYIFATIYLYVMIKTCKPCDFMMTNIMHMGVKWWN